MKQVENSEYQRVIQFSKAIRILWAGVSSGELDYLEWQMRFGGTGQTLFPEQFPDFEEKMLSLLDLNDKALVYKE